MRAVTGTVAPIIRFVYKIFFINETCLSLWREKEVLMFLLELTRKPFYILEQFDRERSEGAFSVCRGKA